MTSAMIGGVDDRRGGIPLRVCRGALEDVCQSCGRTDSKTWCASAPLTRATSAFLEACVAAGLNILVAGGTQAGS